MAAITTGGCSLVAPGLPSQVAGQAPTFSYAHPILPRVDNFGVQITFMSGSSTCYNGAAPTFTPYITNAAASYSRNCVFTYVPGLIVLPNYTGINCADALVTDIPDGPLTIAYHNVASNTARTPIPFTATFGPSPVAATSTVMSTSDVIATTSAAARPSTTVTVTSSGSPVTQSSTVIVTQSTTSTNTVYVSSCSSTPSPTPSSSSSRPSSAPSSAPFSTSSPTPVPSSSSMSLSSSSPSPSASPTSSTSSRAASSSSVSASPSSGSPSSNAAPSSSPTPSASASPSPSASSSPSPSAVSSSSSASSSATPSPNVSSSPSPISTPSSSPSPSATPSSSPSAVSSSSSPISSPITSSSASSNASPSSAPSSSSSSSPASSASSSTSSSASPTVSPVPSSSPSPVSLSASPSSVPVTTVTQTVSASPSASAAPDISCPGSDGQSVSTPEGAFIIECYYDRFDSDLGQPSFAINNFSQCIGACAITPSCVDVSYIPDGPCYLKSGLGAPNYNTGVWGARLASASSTTVSPAPAPTPTSATSTSAAPTSSVTCPASNGQIVQTNAGPFQVECSVDRAGFDMTDSPVYPGTFEGCAAACAARTGCVQVSYVPNGPCYLKSGSGAANSNGGVIGGRLLTGGSSSAPASSPVVTVTSATTASASSTPVITAPSTTSSPTITVTTTVSSTVFQCTPVSTLTPSSTPTGTPNSGSVLTCPGSDGVTYTSECGAVYAVECSVDRYGNDLPGVTIPYVNTLNECLRACDNTPGCVDVSYVLGTPGPCYMKGSIGDIRMNSNILGGRQINGCTASSPKLHRKRVVHEKKTKSPLKKRAAVGPDFTYVGSATTATRTLTVTTTSTSTITPTSGATTTMVSTTATNSVTVTQVVTNTSHAIVTQTVCPTTQVF